MSEDEGHSEGRLLAALQAVLDEVAEPTAVLRTILTQAVRSTEADRGLFVEVRDDGGLDYRVLHRVDPSALDPDPRRFSRGIFGRVLERGRAIRVDDASDDSDVGAFKSVVDFRMISILCAPLRVGDRIAALVHLENGEPGHFTPRHEAALSPLLRLAGSALGALHASEGVMRRRDALRASAEGARGEIEDSRRFLARNWSFGRFVGRSRPVRDLEERVRRASRNEFPVLLVGETGTGKSILARVLHHAGTRAERPLITVFCPSLEPGRVEAELFGHRRGAFTGADADRIGKIQAAEGGTLFLDEIGDLPLSIQPKLLRLLQERTYERVGDPSERRADVRIVAATNRDLEVEIREGRFRRDLYARLNYLPIRIPPLRERPDDIPLLLRHCLDQHDAGRWIEVADEAIAWLRDLDFAWPGNVRHLEHLAARLATEEPRGAVGIATLRDLLGSDAGGEAPARQGSAPSLEAGLPALLAHAERTWIEEALRRHPDLSRAELARRLRISETTLFKKLKQHGFTR